jgi:hypothetical protein
MIGTQKKLLAGVAVALLAVLAGCASEPPPTPDEIASQAVTIFKQCGTDFDSGDCRQSRDEFCDGISRYLEKNDNSLVINQDTFGDDNMAVRLVVNKCPGMYSTYS